MCLINWALQHDYRTTETYIYLSVAYTCNGIHRMAFTVRIMAFWQQEQPSPTETLLAIAWVTNKRRAARSDLLLAL